VEADGPFHDAARDEVRDSWLSAQGFRVLRIPNAEIERGIVSRILDAIGHPARGGEF
jgi:very-short-patch-repair endonuclease